MTPHHGCFQPQSQPKDQLAELEAQGQEDQQSRTSHHFSVEVRAVEVTYPEREGQRISNSSLETKLWRQLVDPVWTEYRHWEARARGADTSRIWHSLPNTAWTDRELGMDIQLSSTELRLMETGSHGTLLVQLDI